MKKRIVWLIGRFNFSFAGKWLVLGSLVGVASGLGAIGLQFGLQALRELCLTGMAGLDLGYPSGEPPELGISLHSFVPYLVVLLPALGGLVAGVLVFWLAPEAEGHGTDAAIDAYHRKLGRMRSRVPLVKMVASAITIGTGGSGGREGPIAQIGAGFGSFLATRLGLSSKDRRMLLAAGIGGGVGAIFRTPLAGAIFAAEVLYSSAEVEAEVILPAMVSSIVGYAVYTSRFGWEHMFSAAHQYGFTNPLELGPYVVLAAVVALAALLYVKSFYGAREAFGRLRMPKYLKPMVGGAITGAVGLGFIFAFQGSRDAGDVLSSGYGILQHILDSDGADLPVVLLVAVGLGKIVTTSASIGSGGSGGVFGPSMVIGGTLGAAVGNLFHRVAPDVVAHPMTFAVVGMAGFFSAAAKTPISTVIMVSELTGDYELLIPSMWVCSLAFLVSRDWTIYKSQSPFRSLVESPAGGPQPAAVMQSPVGAVFRKKRRFVHFQQDLSVAEAALAAQATRQRVFPVVDAGGNLIGAFRIDQLTHSVQKEEAQASVVADLIDDRSFFVKDTDTLEHAQRMLRSNNLEEVLVLEGSSRKIAGILTVADILLEYQRVMAEPLSKPATEEPSHPDLPLPSN